MNINIKDAFLMKNKKFIILISYTPGIELNNFFDLFQKSLNLKLLFLHNDNLYPNNINFINFNDLTEKIYGELSNIDKIKNIPNLSKNGPAIAIFGLSFPPDKIKFNYDLHIHLSLSKKLFNKSITDNDIKNIDPEYYNKSIEFTKDNKINKYFNVKSYDDDDFNQLLDNIFDYIIEYWEKSVYGKNYDKLSSKTIQKSKIDESNDSLESERSEEITDTLEDVTESLNNITETLTDTNTTN